MGEERSGRKGGGGRKGGCVFESRGGRGWGAGREGVCLRAGEEGGGQEGRVCV